MSAPVELVIFDLGRVMIRLCDGWRHACELAGVEYRPGYDAHPQRDDLLRVMMRHEVGAITCDQWAQQTAAMVGITPGDVAAIAACWLAGPFEGYEALLDGLRSRGLRTACLSNTNATHWRTMTAPDGPNALPLSRMDYRFASHLIGAAKPDAAIYAHVEAHTGVAPDRIVFFDDSPPNVDAALRRGWHAFAITPERQPVEQVRRHLAAVGVEL